MLEKADVYSFGVVMWEVLTRKVPYQDNNGNDGHHHHHYNLGHLIQAVLDGKRPVVPSDCPPAFAKLMKRCWHRNPRKRPDMDQVLLSLNQLSGTCGP